jgi:hypothetical protein
MKKQKIKNMQALETIQKTREYLDYIEEHILNVEKAWKILQETCKSMRFVWDDYVYYRIGADIKRHDMSKLSKEELVQYRRNFFPTSEESVWMKEKVFKNIVEDDFDAAWESHKKHNNHHWENWTKKEFHDPYQDEICCVHMICDWMAMSMKFGDTPKSYYEKNKERIDLPDWAIKFIYEIFDNLEKAQNNKEQLELKF